MAPAAVKAWKQVLLLLEKQQHAQAHSQQTDSSAARQVSDEIDTIYAELNCLNMVPRAAWKKIIRDMEVSPQRWKLLSVRSARLLTRYHHHVPSVCRFGVNLLRILVWMGCRCHVGLQHCAVSGTFPAMEHPGGSPGLY